MDLSPSHLKPPAGPRGSRAPGAGAATAAAWCTGLAAPDFCYLPSVCGNCKALFIRFFYNASSQRCEEFIYGGCGGNRNNFETKRECFQACSHLCVVLLPEKSFTMAPSQPQQPGCSQGGDMSTQQASCPRGKHGPDICHLPPEHGPCRGHFYRYAYNPATGTCRVFLYGGCRGNANNFETLKECHCSCAWLPARRSSSFRGWKHHASSPLPGAGGTGTEQTPNSLARGEINTV
uniref:BPTI/Kunitz inhibitor domain-containing protein n=1 Tax=Anser brachyrhynchus TaxID=132585 RepID=A0A8B9BUT9_9AVES